MTTSLRDSQAPTGVAPRSDRQYHGIAFAQHETAYRERDVAESAALIGGHFFQDGDELLREDGRLTAQNHGVRSHHNGSARERKSRNEVLKDDLGLRSLTTEQEDHRLHLSLMNVAVINLIDGS